MKKKKTIREDEDVSQGSIPPTAESLSPSCKRIKGTAPMAFGIHKKMDKNIKKIRSRGKKSRGLNQHKIRADP